MAFVNHYQPEILGRQCRLEFIAIKIFVADFLIFKFAYAA